MQSMKSRHVEIVEQILNAYNGIEQESKSQYRGFVLRLKEQHNYKVGAYKEVVKSLQDELNNMNTHWECTVKVRLFAWSDQLSGLRNKGMAY